MPLEDYKGIVETLASIVTAGQIFSGVFICKDFIKQKSTKNVQPIPFIGGIGIGALFSKYALLIKDPAMIRINIFGILVNIGYLLCFYSYTTDKRKLMRTIFKSSILFGSILLYGQWEDPEKVQFRFGIITTVILFLMVGSPFLQLGEVIRTRSTESLPFPLILSGTFVSFLWLLYGYIINDIFAQVQNSVMLVMSLAQLSLFVIYPSSSSKESKEKRKTL